MRRWINTKAVGEACCVWLVAAVLAGAAGCALVTQGYEERHYLKEVTVVFLDEASLQKEWERVTGDPAVAFRSHEGSYTAYSLHTVRGFYDFRTRTIYCSKMDFEVCGHELHHAILGRFHPHR